jgi:hypothetical protein
VWKPDVMWVAMGWLVSDVGKKASESRQGRKEIAAAVAKEGVFACLPVHQRNLLAVSH